MLFQTNDHQWLFRNLAALPHLTELSLLEYHLPSSLEHVVPLPSITKLTICKTHERYGLFRLFHPRSDQGEQSRHFDAPHFLRVLKSHFPNVRKLSLVGKVSGHKEATETLCALFSDQYEQLDLILWE